MKKEVDSWQNSCEATVALSNHLLVQESDQVTAKSQIWIIKNYLNYKEEIEPAMYTNVGEVKLFGFFSRNK